MRRTDIFDYQSNGTALLISLHTSKRGKVYKRVKKVRAKFDLEKCKSAFLGLGKRAEA